MIPAGLETLIVTERGLRPTTIRWDLASHPGMMAALENDLGHGPYEVAWRYVLTGLLSADELEDNQIRTLDPPPEL